MVDSGQVKDALRNTGRDDMKSLLSDEEFDVLVLGGGVFGAATVWQATQMGLKAAMIEANDFGHGSSANSYKIIHGGIRYLQHLDFARVWASCRERSSFLRTAPHLCEPLPVVIPTYGWGKLSMPFLGVGCLLYDLLTWRRNRGIKDKSRHIRYTRFVGKKTVLAHFPEIEKEGLTGACIIEDGRFLNPTRLVWAYCESALSAGARICNYLKAEDLILDGERVCGAVATDQMDGARISINASVVINATGPWAERWLAHVTRGKFIPKGVYSRDACFVVKNNGRLTTPYSIAIQGGSGDPDAVLAREKRHLFLSPWRDCILVGVWHKVTSVAPEEVSVSKHEIETYLREINASSLGFDLTMADVTLWNAGLVPFGEEQTSDVDLSYGKRSNLIDHGVSDGLNFLFTLIGLRYTMARGEAEKVIEQVLLKLHKQVPRVRTDFTALSSARFTSVDCVTDELNVKLCGLCDALTIQALVQNYGKNAFSIAEMIVSRPELAVLLPGTTVTAAEVLFVCRSEMVEHLSDIVFRRTDLGTAGNPGKAALEMVANLAAKENSWDTERMERELNAVRNQFQTIS